MQIAIQVPPRAHPLASSTQQEQCMCSCLGEAEPCKVVTEEGCHMLTSDSGCPVGAHYDEGL
jgi:hypothetical protein